MTYNARSILSEKKNPIQFLDHETFSTENNGIVKIFDSLLHSLYSLNLLFECNNFFGKIIGENFLPYNACECFYAVSVLQIN